MATTLDGEALAARLRDDLRESVERLADAGVRPGLATVHMGDDPAAESYVEMKQRDCAELGIDGTHVDLDPDESAATLHDTIADLNVDPAVHGILIQDDVPDHVDWRAAVREIDPEKDVDGLHPENVGRLVAGDPRFVPCTPLGIQRLLAEYEIDLAGAHVVVVNRSMIVGKPLAALLTQRGEGGDATVTVCHSRTDGLAEKTWNADVLVVAVDDPEFLDGSMVSEGTTVVDVGIGRVPADTERGYELVGDVEAASVEPKADYFAPVPGGVGPMTRVMLHRNTVEAVRIQAGTSVGEERQ
ncbi:tetrahydrofolate dehydrogenase/cyclohydrolase catalytic domain-containing protein [Halosimplex salinum]|uniref:tetrahydrofolate dehydrogenase/cyclohydrolase catalytic domain-containing protein n=1 Tax=Halosimplex salinum TaxID=1710538 RepID=UPI000F49EC3C|nr:tetrahydrofolate dehydrogenase/cyclohydrolase catalytic domain-containing protein [Halosimplex salinum]